MSTTDNDQQPPKRPLAGGGAAYLMIVSVVIGVAIGLALDRHYGTRPWWTLGMSMLFLIAGFYLMIRESRR